MKKISENILRKLEQLGAEVEKGLKKKGIAIPVRNDNGSVSIGKYTIVKENNYFKVINDRNQVEFDQINLPQTAVILANNLECGRYIDPKLILKDKNYGYAEFEETLQRQLGLKLMQKDFTRASVVLAKSTNNQQKKELYKKDIVSVFEKLRKFA